MRAMRLVRQSSVEDSPLQLVELPDLEPAPLELAIEVEACAVCRTDLQLVEGDIEAHRLPVTPGHQIVGTVAALGAGVAGWKIGDRAGVGWVAGACGECVFCAGGRENLCRFARFTGWDRDGGFADQVKVRADFAFPLPAGPTGPQLAPLLCGGVIGYRSLRVAGIQPGGRLGLFGFGASASLTIQVAAHWGCETYVFTRSESEQRRAIELGAVWAGSYADRAPERLDAAITFAPAGSVVVQALRALERGGVVAINAIHLDEVPRFDYDDLWLERQIRSVANYTRRDALEFLDLAVRIPVVTTTDGYPLAGANEALGALRAGSLGGIAVLLMG